MKKCSKCQRAKVISEFHKHKFMSQGVLNICKTCRKEYAAKYRKNNSEKLSQFDKKRANLPNRVEARKLYATTDAYKISQAKGNKKYRENNPNKYKAHNIVNNSIAAGKLFKEACQICGKTKGINAHHDDYAKPLNVRWLCNKHHIGWHKENGEALNP